MKRTLTIIIAAILIFTLTACAKSGITPKYSRDSYYFNTTSVFYVYDDFSSSTAENRYDSTFKAALDILENVENSVSPSVASSDVAAFNNLSYGESVKISKTTAEIVLIAKKAYEDTKGLYDPTVYPLVDLWGFTPRFNESVFVKAQVYDRERNLDGSYDAPDEKYLTAFTSLTGFDKITLTGDEINGFYLTKNIPSVTVDGVEYNAKIDFGGIGKGYAADKIKALMIKNGYEMGYFSTGTSSIALLKSGSDKATDGNFDLQIKSPRKTDSDNSSYLVAKVKDVSVSSSGDYEHFYNLNDDVICHIINPFTGYPMNVRTESDEKIATVTVIGESAAYLDAVTTALCLMDLEDAKKYVSENLSQYSAFIVTYGKTADAYSVYAYTKLDYSILDTNYVLEEVYET